MSRSIGAPLRGDSCSSVSRSSEPGRDATSAENNERDFAGEVLARIEERESEVRATLERLIKQRAAISRGERNAAWDALRAEAMTTRGELRRLRLLASMADALLGPVSLCPRSRPARGTTIR